MRFNKLEHNSNTCWKATRGSAGAIHTSLAACWPMSAIGIKRTLSHVAVTSAFDPKRTYVTRRKPIPRAPHHSVRPRPRNEDPPKASAHRPSALPLLLAVFASKHSLEASALAFVTCTVIVLVGVFDLPQGVGLLFNSTGQAFRNEVEHDANTFADQLSKHGSVARNRGKDPREGRQTRALPRPDYRLQGRRRGAPPASPQRQALQRPH